MGLRVSLMTIWSEDATEDVTSSQNKCPTSLRRVLSLRRLDSRSDYSFHKEVREVRESGRQRSPREFVHYQKDREALLQLSLRGTVH
jgi:hypothetical protein